MQALLLFIHFFVRVGIQFHLNKLIQKRALKKIINLKKQIIFMGDYLADFFVIGRHGDKFAPAVQHELVVLLTNKQVILSINQLQRTNLHTHFFFYARWKKRINL